SVKGQGAWSWLRPKYLLVARLALALAERLLKFLKPPLTNRGVTGGLKGRSRYDKYPQKYREWLI
ncbi:hypothetical protein BMS93_09205, partial [Leuconostoc pseudomesenteroides]